MPPFSSSGETPIPIGAEAPAVAGDAEASVRTRSSTVPSREERATQLRAAGRPTLPSTLGEERATNPFLRCAEPVVVESANKYLGARVADPVRVFAAIREWKNRF